MSNPQMRAYVSGALTDTKDRDLAVMRTFYENIAKLLDQEGYAAYVPHLYGDPQLVAHLAAEDIDAIDRKAVALSYLMVAYVGIPSLGVGIEIELAHHANVPVILMYEKSSLDQRKISRLVRGNPAVVAHVVFDDFDDALDKLKEALQKFHETVAGNVLPDILKHNPKVDL